MDRWSANSRTDGDNLVREAREVTRDGEGKKIVDHDSRDDHWGPWQWTGRVRERVYAPDGSVVSERSE